MNQRDIKYLELLAKNYPNVNAAAAEVVRLQAILELPKTTEHFMSDIHGEYSYFTHILKNASGAIHSKLDDTFGDLLGDEEKNALALLLYYPERELARGHTESWYRVTIHRLIAVCRTATDKYTRAKVRVRLPEEFSYLIEELIDSDEHDSNKRRYFESIINNVISAGIADQFIVALANLISRLTVDRLHICGDVFDRGPAAQMVMDDLMHRHGVDFVWGNHDILWMGAAMGNAACIANALRNSLKYGNFDTLEDGYGINVRPLAVFAVEQYGSDPCTYFQPTYVTDFVGDDSETTAKILKAVTVIQFKLEGQLIRRHPEYGMDDRLLLDKIDYEHRCITVDGVTWPLEDTDFPTVDPADPYTLTPEENAVIDQLTASFERSEKLQAHVRFLYSKGSLYTIYNGNLLFHGCIPMTEEGEFLSFPLGGKERSGKAFLDWADTAARQAYYYRRGSAERKLAMDFLWFLWAGRNSPIFGRDRMTTFERRLIADERAWTEPKNAYYTLYQDPAVCDKILKEFGLGGPHCHIINGHVPVKAKKGESPIKGGGKLIVIDGGFCKAYQRTSGIAGYTLIHNSHSFRIVAHQPFAGRERAIRENFDISSSTDIFERLETRRKIGETDRGREIKTRIDDLRALLDAFRDGAVKEDHGKTEF